VSPWTDSSAAAVPVCAREPATSWAARARPAASVAGSVPGAARTRTVSSAPAARRGPAPRSRTSGARPAACGSAERSVTPTTVTDDACSSSVRSMRRVARRLRRPAVPSGRTVTRAPTSTSGPGVDDDLAALAGIRPATRCSTAAPVGRDRPDAV
jgi:hypothetical protein